MPTITATASALASAIGRVERAVPSGDDDKSVVGVYSGVRGVTMFARNRSIGAHTHCQFTDAADTSFNLSRQAISAIRSIAARDPDAPVTLDGARNVKTKQFEEDDKTLTTVPYDVVTVSARRSSFNIDVLHLPIQHPTLPAHGKSIQIDAEHARVAFSLLGDVRNDVEGSWNFTGIHFGESDSEGVARASAADGRRVGIVNIPATGDLGVVVPSRLIRSVASIVADHEGPVVIRYDDRLCAIDVGDTVFYSPLDTRAFPNLAPRIETARKRGTDAGSIDRETLVRSLQQAAITTNRKLGVVGVTIESVPPVLRITSQAPDAGSSIITPPTALQKPFRIAVDPSYVVPVLRRIKDESVRLVVEKDVAILLESSSLTYFLMGIVAE
jgi:hypothetical protein